MIMAPILERGIAFLEVQLRNVCWDYGRDGERFLFLVEGMDGDGSALRQMERDGLFGARLTCRWAEGSTLDEVVDARPMFLHSSAVAYAVSVRPDKVVLLNKALPAILGTDPTHYAISQETIIEFLVARLKDQRGSRVE